MRTANPALNSQTFAPAGGFGRGVAVGGETMTIEGTVNKTGLLLFCLLIPAAWAWSQVLQTPPGSTSPTVTLAMYGGMIGGAIFAIATIFKKEWAPFTAPLYAACEGLALGAVSALFNQQYRGIAMQAVALTFGTLFALLFAYRSGLIRATENFRLGVTAATGAIALLYLATWVLRLFGTTVPFIHESGMIGIGFSLVVVVIAALNLVLDFDFIEQGAARGAPRYMEWYAAFGLLVTLVWLYLEILRLLAKMNDRRR